MKLHFSIHHPGELSAGIRPFDDTVTVEVESGDPGGEPGEFAGHMRTGIEQWFDGARVTIGGPEPYDKAFGDDRACVCGHAYYRHFDTYERMAPIGCKYCECSRFKELTPNVDGNTPCTWICPECKATTDEPAMSFTRSGVFCPECDHLVELDVNPEFDRWAGEKSAQRKSGGTFP